MEREVSRYNRANTTQDLSAKYYDNFVVQANGILPITLHNTELFINAVMFIKQMLEFAGTEEIKRLSALEFYSLLQKAQLRYDAIEAEIQKAKKRQHDGR